MRTITRILFLVVISITLGGVLYAQGSKVVSQQLFDLGGYYYDEENNNIVHPEEGTLDIRIYFVSRPNYYLDGPSHIINADLVEFQNQPDRFLIRFNLINFDTIQAPSWSPGEIFRIEVVQNETGYIAVDEFPITQGSAPQLRDISNGQYIVLSEPPNNLFDSNEGDPISTTANLMEGYPDDNYLYRADGCVNPDRYWQIQFSTLGFEDLSFTSEINRKFQGPMNTGPRYFTTYYSIDGQEWIPYGNPNDAGGFIYWELADNQNWATMAFNLPQDCEEQEVVYIRWLHLHDWGGVNNNGWGELRNVSVTGYGEAPPPPEEYTLTMEIIGEGSTEPAAGESYVYETGSDVEITAIADVEGWIFEYWSLVVGHSDPQIFEDNIITVSMDNNITATARFIEWPNPNPTVAVQPIPEDEAEQVTIELENLGWSYIIDEDYSNPVGFRVYIDESEDFNEEVYSWIDFDEQEETYTLPVPIALSYDTAYYWKVVPTTIYPEQRMLGLNESRRRGSSPGRETLQNSLRGDAVNVPIWAFTTEEEPVTYQLTMAVEGYGTTDPEAGAVYTYEENSEITIEAITDVEGWIFEYWMIVIGEEDPEFIEELVTVVTMVDNITATAYFLEWPNPYPTVASNPVPEDGAAAVPVGIEELSWDYIVDEDYTNPVGFRVYTGSSEEFDDMHFWVPYIEDQVTYAVELPQGHIELLPVTTYYWKVVPTINHPDDETLAITIDERNRNVSSQLRQSTNTVRGDAQDVPIWSFTTGALSVDDEQLLSPYMTGLHGNYPNPFNPETSISFSVSEPGNVKIDIFNSRGQKVKTLVDKQFDVGRFSISWNGRDDLNNEVGSGIYLYRMQKGSFTATDKMILMK